MAGYVDAGPDDTFCSIAVQHGFVDCQPLRDHPRNLAIHNRQLQEDDGVWVPDVRPGVDAAPTAQTTRFVRRGLPLADIRFVHGSRWRTCRNDRTLRFLNISNFRTDRAGATETANWVDHNHRTYDANANADEDAFKVEVLDVRTAQNDLQVELDALCPTYHAVTGAVTGHQPFPGNRTTAGTQANRRSLDVTASRHRTSRRFRTCYLRLVVDDEDHGAAPGRPLQTLLVTDDVRAGGNQQIEILDQQVRATYKLEDCPAAGDAQCRVTETVPVGEDQRRLRIAVHVLKNVPGAAGNPLVALAQTRWRINKWVRRLYAQANVAPTIIQVRAVDPPDDMLVVSELQGNRAAGDETMSFRVRVTPAAGGAATDVDINDYRPPANQTPVATANALASRIRRGLTNPPHSLAGVGVDVRRNCELILSRGRPTDLLIHVANCRVTIENLVSTGSRQHLAAVSVDPFAVQFGGPDANTGSSDHRCIMRNYDTGEDRLDLFVIGDHHNNVTGRGIMPLSWAPAAKRADSQLRRNCFCVAATMGNTDNCPYLAAHEGGHAVMDIDHTDDTTQLMMGRAGAEPAANTADGAKRIADREIAYTRWGTWARTWRQNLVRRLRRHGRPALTNW
ncbi:MAG: hypothetical protein KKI02_10565 [Planctomycetes bacterium]|nr:hypothetical protein [Planctomycetota bacterium]